MPFRNAVIIVITPAALDFGTKLRAATVESAQAQRHLQQRKNTTKNIIIINFSITVLLVKAPLACFSKYGVNAEMNRHGGLVVKASAS